MNDILAFAKEWPFWLWNLLVITTAILIGIIIELVILKLLRFFRATFEKQFIGSMRRHLAQPLNVFLPSIILQISFPLIKLSEETGYIFKNTLFIINVLAFAWILIRLVKIGEDYVVSTYDLSKEDNFKERKIRTQLQYVRRIVIIGIMVVAISVVLLSFDSVRELGAGLLTSAGVAGIIIGFAAQRSLANLFAGFQIAFTQPIRIDDVLVVEGEWGKVEEITLTYVVVRIWDQRRLVLPINYFIEKPFQNWTRVSADILGTVFIYSDYKIPLQPLREELTRLLNNNSLWDGKVNVLQVTDSKETTMELRALMSARNSPDAWDLRCQIREGLITFIQENYPESLPRARAEIAGLPKSGKDAF